MLGVDRSAKACIYQYPYNNVKEFIQFCQLLTRFGEAGVYGFLGQLDSRPAAQILLQSITTEARQQMAFRQLQGLPAQPEWCTSSYLSSHRRQTDLEPTFSFFFRFIAHIDSASDMQSKPVSLNRTPGLCYLPSSSLALR